MLLFLVNLFLLKTGIKVGGISLGLSIFFAIWYLLLQNAWETLTVNGKAIHVALTRENPETNLRAPAIFLSLPAVVALSVAIYLLL